MITVSRNFDPEIAKEINTDAAILLHNIEFWQANAKANNSNLHDGRYWHYNSCKAFTKQFTWLSEKQIRTYLDKLIKAGYLVTGNYNKKNYDKTKWYSSTRNFKELKYEKPLPKREETHLPNGQSPSDQMGEPIPDIKHTDLKQERENSHAQDKPKQLTPEEKEVEAYKQYLKQQKSDYPDDWIMTPNGSYRPPHASDKYKQQEDSNPRQLKHVDFVKEHAAGAYESQIKMRYAAKIKDRDSFIRKFNNKCVIKEVPFKTSTILAEMENFAITWISNQK